MRFVAKSEKFRHVPARPVDIISPLSKLVFAGAVQF